MFTYESKEAFDIWAQEYGKNPPSKKDIKWGDGWGDGWGKIPPIPPIPAIPKIPDLGDLYPFIEGYIDGKDKKAKEEAKQLQEQIKKMAAIIEAQKKEEVKKVKPKKKRKPRKKKEVIKQHDDTIYEREI